MKRKTVGGILTFAFLLFAGIANATVYTVTSAADAGAGTLRQAIIDLNATGTAANTINFAITPLGGVKTITLVSDLPAITKQVTINGYSQSGAAQGTIAGRTIMIELLAAAGVISPLEIDASNTVISGIALSVTDPDAGGINCGTTSVVSNVQIWGCYFNTNAAGTAVTGKGYAFAIYGNTNQSSNTVSNLQNWVIGTNGDGTNDANEGNLFTAPPASATDGYAEPVRVYTTDNFIIAGNTFGLQKNGTTPLQTFTTSGVFANYGIAITNCKSFRIGTDGNGVSDALERNVFAGMRNAAVVLFANVSGGTLYNDGDVTYDNNRPNGNHLIAGNYFGTDINGATPAGTKADLRNLTAIQIRGTDNNIVGSATNAAMRNIIVNSSSNGVEINGEKFYEPRTYPANNNNIAGNYIGVLPDGTTAAGNIANGIRINKNTNVQAAGDLSATFNIISKNIIANNGNAGIDIRPNNNTRAYDNTFTQNSIYGNTNLGINLGSSTANITVTPNDGILGAITTTNSNLLTDYGIITSMSLSGTNLTISGYVGNNPAGNASWANAVVEFFIADNSPADQNGEIILGDGKSVAHGEGKTYLGSLTANGAGLFSGTLNVSGKGVTAGTTAITNTATEQTSAGSTSEFGPNMIVQLISGNVFNDLNGLNASPVNTVDGTGLNPGGLNAVLYDNTTGAVTATVPVNADGTYNFSAVGGVNYTVYITTNTVTVGQTAVPVVALPAGWVNTGENNCVITAGCTGNDGAVNGVLPLGVVNSTITQANFGIEQPPTAGSGITNAGSNPGGTVQATVPPSTFTNTTVSSDPGGGAVTQIHITGFPTGATSIVINGVSYTSATFPAGGVYVPADAGGNPLQTITVDPAAAGTTSVSIPFKAVDAAGMESSNTGTAVINFTSVLPVTLVSFDATAAGRQVNIKWSTSSEINTASFEIERSAGNVFKLLHTTAAAGNSAITLNYSTTDLSPLNGTSFYRLKIKDKDGSFTYSNVVKVRMKESGSALSNIYPNPFTDKLTVIIELNNKTNVTLTITDAAGKAVKTLDVAGVKGTNLIDVKDLSALAGGMYILHITAGEDSFNEKIFKN